MGGCEFAVDSEVVIRLEDVRKSFRDGKVEVEVLKGVNLEVRRGEKIAIVGASGSGKTTLLSIIGTILKPSAGKVFLFGEDVTEKEERALDKMRGKRISFVFQNGYLIEELSPLENVEFFASRILGKVAHKIAKSILEEFGVPARKNVWELSGGEYQRVALARAIAVRPEILLADEPTGNLDPETAEKIINQTLNVCNSSNITFLMVTHNIALAQKLDKIYKLENGVLKLERG